MESKTSRLEKAAALVLAVSKLVASNACTARLESSATLSGDCVVGSPPRHSLPCSWSWFDGTLSSDISSGLHDSPAVAQSVSIRQGDFEPVSAAVAHCKLP